MFDTQVNFLQKTECFANSELGYANQVVLTNLHIVPECYEITRPIVLWFVGAFLPLTQLSQLKWHMQTAWMRMRRRGTRRLTRIQAV